MATIKEKVIASQNELKILNIHTDLRNWAINNGMDNRSAFPKFKSALKEIGIDYDKIKTGISSKEKENLLISITHSVTLYTDAKASAGRFCICDKNGKELWYGQFFENDDAKEQSKSEVAAAKKAIWLASKIAEANNIKSIKLYLLTDAQWLTYQDHGGQKGYVLTILAKKLNIDLHVEWIPGKDNPADFRTTGHGFKKWQDNNLQGLVIPIE